MKLSQVLWNPTKKQREAFNYLQDKTTTELFYGGGAGGGKSYLGAVWITSSCLKYSGSRWLVGRAVLKHLKSSTLLTFFDLFKSWGLEAEKDYHYNTIEGVITFFNDSQIYLRDLEVTPSDPEFDRLGSTEYTGAFIDECSQVSTKAKNIVMSRLRYKLEDFKIVPKLLLCSNPTKNFLYYEFYKPFKAGELLPYRKFVPALVGDNPFISTYYVENLKKLDRVSKERLLYGNFEYDEDPAKLFEYDKILDMFTNAFAESVHDKRYLTVDVARFGSDKTVITQWKGLYVEKIHVLSKQGLDVQKSLIENLMKELSIPRSQVAIDEDGIGGGLVDSLKGVKGFVNNSRPFINQRPITGKPVISNYGNLKSQCYFAFAEAVNNGLVGVYKDVPVEIKEFIIQELEQVKRKDADKDGKILVTPKELIKENIGRSPDFADSLMMRFYFEVYKLPEYKPIIK